MTILLAMRRLPAACLLLFVVNQPASATELSEQQAILVTGASTGIGRLIAERLAGEGYFVYAGARKAADIEALSAIDNVQGIRLDVTVQSEMNQAVMTIRDGGRGLYGVVNNAGVVTMGILAETAESELDFVFDVNVYGPYRVVKSFAPMLVESNGRIVNISSMAGVFSPPAYGVYSMSKHALESFSDSLAFEMGTVGVKVAVVEPGPYRSSGFASFCERRLQQERTDSGSLFTDLASDLNEICDNSGNDSFPAPDPVADAVVHAISSDEPKRRYLAITERAHLEMLIRNLFGDLGDLNSNGHDFQFSREELISILDSTLAPTGKRAVL